MLSLRLLGTYTVSLDGQRIQAFASNKERALLAYLAVEANRPHRRDELATLLWPELPAGKARNNFRVTLHRLRQAVEHPDTEAIEATRETVRLSPDVEVQVDVNLLSRKLEAVRRHGDEGGLCPACHTRLTEATKLYRGEFLAGFVPEGSQAFHDWVRLQREWYHRRVLDALDRLAQYYLWRGEIERAQKVAHRQIELEPWREQAHRQLMRTLACAGNYNAALTQFKTCRQILADELGVEPAQETERLYDEILVARETHFHPLPHLPHSLVGREEELAYIGEQLADPACRLLTLVGPGGIGKSRLALEVAREQADSRLHGVCYVPLAAVASADGLLRAIARAANYVFQNRGEQRSELLDYLKNKEMLLVLDNFEHLVIEQELLALLLTYAPALKILVTSRVRLHFREEFVLELEGLAIPDPDGGKQVEPAGAVRLFVERAREAEPSFTLSAESRLTVLQICEHLSGIPLAIELAASWVRVLTPQEMLARIRHGLDLLESPKPDVPDRHRSLRASFEHSWELLDEEARDALMKLSIFRDGFTVEAAQAVAGASLRTLTSLVDWSLLWHDVPAGRLDMHDLLRHFAGEKLRQAKQSETTGDAHSNYYLQILADFLPDLEGHDQLEALAAIDADFENVRAAWRWAAERQQTQRLGQSAHGLYTFCRRSGTYREGEALFALLTSRPTTAGEGSTALAIRGKFLARQAALITLLSEFDRARALIDESLDCLPAGPARPEEQAFALAQLGKLEWKMGAYAQAEATLAESLALYRKVTQKTGIALTEKLLGNVALAQGQYAAAREYYHRSIALYRSRGDRLMVAFLLNNLGLVASGQKDQERAKQFHRESLSLKRELGMSGETIAVSLLNLGWTHYLLAEYVEARPLLREALARHRVGGNAEGEVMALLLLSYVARQLQELLRAQELACQALQQALDIHSRPRLLESVVAIAGVLSLEDNRPWALALLTFANTHPVADAVIRLHSEPLIERLRNSLTAAEIAAAEQRAEELTVDEVVRRLRLSPCLEVFDRLD